jgi:hypothetical protein
VSGWRAAGDLAMRPPRDRLKGWLYDPCLSIAIIVSAAFVFTPLAEAQKGGQAQNQSGQQANQGAQGGQPGQAGSGAQGLSFTPAEWPELVLPDLKGPAPTFKNGRTVLCYRLVNANSALQPFVLERVKAAEVAGTGFSRPCGEKGSGETDTEGRRQCTGKDIEATQHWNACSALRDRTPILGGQSLVVGIDLSTLSERGLNLDQMKLLTINVTNQQSAPLNPSPVRPTFPGSAAGGSAGNSTGSAGEAEEAAGAGGWWIPAGAAPPGGANQGAWKYHTKYHTGDVVTDSTGQHYFTATADFCSGPRPYDPFPRQKRVDRVLDGSVIWQETNAPQDSANDPGFQKYPLWAAQTSYAPGKVVRVERDEVLQEAFQQLQRVTASFDQLLQPIIEQMRRQSSTAGRPAVAANQPLPAVSQSLALEGLKASITPTPAQPGKTSCGEQPLLPNKPRQPIWHFYAAVSGGTSGPVPKDPLSIVLIPRAIYLPWPYELPGDAIPTFSVSMVYSPPVPGAPWQGNTFYPAGSVVTPSTANGHYYVALTGGTSNAEPQEPRFPADVPPSVKDGDLVWLDAGTSSPGGSGGPAQGTGAQQAGANPSAGKAQQWLPATHYLMSDVVLDPYNGHYYSMVQATGGISGKAPNGAPDPFPQIPAETTLRDGDLLWLQTDTAVTQRWRTGHYAIPSSIRASNGLSYTLIGATASAGRSSATFPMGADARKQDGDVIWLDSGRSAAGPATWNKETLYSVGESVVGPDGKLYVMVGTAGGNSGPSEPVANVSGRPTTVTDGDLLWMDVGTAPPAGASFASWRANYRYPLDAIVVATGANPHYYRMIRFMAGTSGTAPESPFLLTSTIVGSTQAHTSAFRVSDGTIVWTKVDQGTPKKWEPRHSYTKDDIVYPPEGSSTQDLWRAMNTGFSGDVPAQPSFPILQASNVVEPGLEVQDGAVKWADSGIVRPTGAGSGEPRPWARNSTYAEGETIFVPGSGNGRYYTALLPGKTGDASPFAFLSRPFPVTWQNVGTTAPAAVASGQPADQTVSLVNLALPQVHTLSYFNISAGVIGTFKRAPTFGFIPSNSTTAIKGTSPFTTPKAATGLAVDPATGCTYDPPGSTTTPQTYYCPSRTGTGPRSIDPVLVLTTYFPPVDAERQWGHTIRDFVPGFSLGASLSSPTNNFYVGGSNEIFVRNIQAFYGLAFQKVAKGLGAPTSQPAYGGVGTAPSASTAQGFQRGFFVGVTYNLSGFFQTLFSGGGAKSSQ